MDQVLVVADDDAMMAKQAVCAAFAAGRLPGVGQGIEATDGPEWVAAVDALLAAHEPINQHGRST